MELNKIKKEKKESEQKLIQTCYHLMMVRNRQLKYNKDIKRLQQLTYMEEDLEFYYWYSNQTNLFSKQKVVLTDPLLLKINNELPNEIINCIQEHFTFETRALLLESKYNPLKIINKFNSYQISKIIKVIFSKFILKCLNEETTNAILNKFTTFYNCTPLEEPMNRIKRKITDERVFLKNIVLSFKPNQHSILFELYKYIILLNKILGKR
jgi:hypothetical protein